MTDQDRLEELLNRWEDLRDQKQTLSDEELCRTCPELLGEFRRRVAELKRIDGFLSGGPGGPEEKDELTPAGRYRPIELYAHGGLGEVFMARDEELGREVALKRMRVLEAASSPRVRRFQFEAEITGRLDHPGVVPVYGLGHDASGRLYYAMRFIRGETLQQAVERYHRTYPPGKDIGAGAIAFQKLLRSFLTVCQTIGYAHSQDVIHRDLKPANIMLGHYGETLVVDWGLAKRLTRPSQAEGETLDAAESAAATVPDETMLGQVKGSPAFMSPEQAEGRTDLIGPASDIYSLGATLYMLLAGKMPFANLGLYELLNHAKRGDFPPPRQLRADIPPALEAICLKAMRLKPGERYATALELAADLEHWLADDPVAAWREPWTSRAKRWMRKHQTLTSTVVAAVLVALMGISAVAVQQQQSNHALGEKNSQLVVANQKESDARKRAEAAEKRAEEKAADAKREAEKARIAEQKARRELYGFLILSADRALANGDRGFAEEALDQCPEELRNVEWWLLYRRALASRQTIEINHASIPSISLSSDGTRIAVADLNGPVLVLTVPNGKVLAKLPGPAKRVAFLPDGDHLLIHRSQHALAAGPVELWSIKENKRVADFSMSYDRFVLSGDGKRVAMINVDWPSDLGGAKEVTSRIHVFDALSGKLVALTDAIPGGVADVAFSPDHERLYAIVRLLDTKKDTSPAATFLHGLAASDRFQLQAWSVVDAPKLSLLKPVVSKDGPADSAPVAMAISPDGKQIMVSDQQSGRVIVLDAATGETVKAAGYDLASTSAATMADRCPNLSEILDKAGSLAVSPDGTRLAVVHSDRILVFDRKTGKRLAELAGHLAVPQCVVFDRASNDLYSAGGEDGRIKRWPASLSSGDRIAIPSGQAWKGRGAAFSSDSRSMAVAAADGGIEILTVAGARPVMTLPPVAAAVARDKWNEANRRFPLEENAKHVQGQRASDIRFSPDGKRLTALYYDRLVCVWNISGEKPALVDFVDVLSLDKEQVIDPFAHPFLLSPDGKYLAGALHAGMKHYFSVWEIEHRRPVVLHKNDKSLGMEPKMTFASDGRTFYLDLASPDARPPVLAWDLTTGKPAEPPGVDRLPDPADHVSRDGSRLLEIVDGIIKIKDRQTGRTLLEYGGRDPTYLWAIFSPDGNYILACKTSGAELFDGTAAGRTAQ